MNLQEGSLEIVCIQVAKLETKTFVVETWCRPQGSTEEVINNQSIFEEIISIIL